MNIALVTANIHTACPALGGAFAHGIGHAMNLQQQTGNHVSPGGGSA